MEYHSYNENKIVSVSIHGTCGISDINDGYSIQKQRMILIKLMKIGSVYWLNVG